jgi:nucleoside-diphosphate-sugar epimerase
MPWTVLRPPAVYGPGDKETLGFFRLIKRGAAFLPTADGRVSLIHAFDLASAIVHMAGSPELTGAVTELDDGRPNGYSWNDLVNAAATPMGVNPYRMVVPRTVLRAIARFASAAAFMNREPPMLTLQKVRELRHSDWVCHDTRPIAASGWQPTIGIMEGFAKTIAWYRAHGWL